MDQPLQTQPQAILNCVAPLLGSVQNTNTQTEARGIESDQERSWVQGFLWRWQKCPETDCGGRHQTQ